MEFLKYKFLYCNFFSFFNSKMSVPAAKKNKEEANKEAYSIDAAKEAKSILEKIMGDVSKSSATKQIIIGSTSGWYILYAITFQIKKIFLQDISCTDHKYFIN